MHQPAQAPGPRRNIKRAAIYLDALNNFTAPTPWRMARADAPFGIIGRGCDDLHLVAAPVEPGCHLAGELADTGRLGHEIKAIDQNAHEGSVLSRDDGKTVAKTQAIV